MSILLLQFQRPIAQIGLLSSVSILALYFFNCPLANRYYFALIVSVSIIVFSTHSYKFIKYYGSYKKYENLKELRRIGHTKEACVGYELLYKDLNFDSEFLVEYAETLKSLTRWKEATAIYYELIRRNNINIYYSQLGDCLFRLGRVKEAEENYWKSIYLVPNRFSTRFQLFNFYMEVGRYSEAKEVGNSILTLPIKIKSEEVLTIKDVVSERLLDLPLTQNYVPTPY